MSGVKAGGGSALYVRSVARNSHNRKAAQNATLDSLDWTVPHTASVVRSQRCLHQLSAHSPAAACHTANGHGDSATLSHAAAAIAITAVTAVHCHSLHSDRGEVNPSFVSSVSR